MNTAVTSLPLSPAGRADGSFGSAVRRGFAGFSRRLVVALRAAAVARAQHHLLEFADQCESLQPDLAKELRAAAHQGPLA